MKKLSVFIFALALAQASCFAQFSIAGSAGLNVSNNAAINAPSAFYQNSFQGKFTPFYFAEIRPTYSFGKRWRTSLGVQYSVKGNYSPNNKFSTALAYVDILPTAEYKINKYFSVFGGFNVGFLNAENYIKDGKWGNFVIPIYNKTDFGGLLGMRAYYKNICLSAHFNHSFLNTLDIDFTDENGNVFTKIKFYNQNFQLGVGYIFDFSKG